MMKTTVYIDETLNERLRRIVPGRGLNRFIHQAVTEKVEALEKQQIDQAMREGYLATRPDRVELNNEWDVVDTEDWPE